MKRPESFEELRPHLNGKVSKLDIQSVEKEKRLIDIMFSQAQKIVGKIKVTKARYQVKEGRAQVTLIFGLKVLATVHFYTHDVSKIPATDMKIDNLDSIKELLLWIIHSRKFTMSIASNGYVVSNELEVKYKAYTYFNNHTYNSDFHSDVLNEFGPPFEECVIILGKIGILL